MNPPTNYWLLFWVLNLVIAGPAFVYITVVVAIRGFRDLKEMFRGLAALNAAAKDE